jgi:tetratricopeptide (TPR) repeat protein
MLNHSYNDIYLIKKLTRSSYILLLVLAFQPVFAQKSSEPQPNKDYSEAISIADKHLLAGEYLKAWNEYEKAWNLYQRQSYPESKIDQISKTLANTPLSSQLYENSIRKGDSCFTVKDYKSAITEYFNALRLDPSAQYPKKKLNEVSTVFVDPENETRYRIVLIHAGKSFDRARYDKAISYYQQALLIKPSENWIEKKIEETTVLKEKTFSGMDPYARCLAESENLMEQKKWAEARDGFAKALTLRPKENYPAAKIVLLDHLPALSKSGEPTYSSLIEDADKFYKFQDYENAAIHFQAALNMKPDEAYPKNMLKKLGNKSDDAESLSQNYAAAVINADILSLAGDTKAALIGYKRCIAKQPGDNYVKSRITELTAVSNTSIESSTAYHLAVAKGDKSMASLNYSKALSEFRYASILKPGESYPKEKIEAIQNLIQQEKVKETAKKEVPVEPAVAQIHKEVPVENVFAQAKKEDSEIRSDVKPANNLIPVADIPKPESNKAGIANEEQKTKNIISAEGIPHPKTNQAGAVSEKYKVTAKEPVKILVSADNDPNNKVDTKSTTANLSVPEIKKGESYPDDKTNHSNTLITQVKVQQGTSRNLAVNTDLALKEKQNALVPDTYKSTSENKPGEKAEIINPSIEKQKTVLTVINTPASAPVKVKEEKHIATETSSSTPKTENAKTPIAQKLQEKTVVNKPVSVEQNASQEKYDNAIAFADKAYAEKNYPYAVNGYNAALKIKPTEKYPQEKIAAIKLIQSQENTSQENYKKTILAADKAFNEKDYVKAKTTYQSAANQNPSQKYPQEKIASINVILGQQKARQEKYNMAIANADNAFETKDFISAMTEYKTANSILPTESYPKERIEAITSLMSRQKDVQENYNKAVMAAEKAFAAKDYSLSITRFQSALDLKPEENYPQERITAINTILALDKEKRDKQYAEYLGKADDDYSKQDFPVAQKEYKMASEIKPDEEYPRERIKQISDLLLAKAKETKYAYESAIADADKAYKELTYDQAVLFYSKALEIKPGEIYPGQMIARIRKNMMDHALVEIAAESFILKNDSERRFVFSPVNASMRKNNYLVVRARISGNSLPKLYINYGNQTMKNGGVVVKNINSELLKDFVINISIQDKWFREDNNWLSLYSENGDLEVASIRISQGK